MVLVRAPLLGVEWEPPPPTRRDASRPEGPRKGAFRRPGPIIRAAGYGRPVVP
jgi:hypothetical protein